MAATVEVNAKVIDNASPKLNEIDKLVESLNKKSVTIKVDTGSGSGTSGTSRATKEIKEISDVLREAGISAEEAGEKAKSVSTQVGAETKKVTETFKKGIGETVQASSDGTVKITHDYEAQRKAAEKTAAAEKNAAEKAAKAEQDSANRRIATFGRIATAAAAAFVIKETKEALNTMKDVDSELANIRKVSGESEEAIAKLGDTAYKTASKYGVAATEYLSSAAEFAKAGYKNYAQLSELAIKTQLVGDVSAETASKFLLSADAAYKMGGNIDSLSAVLDRANVIENNYATSIYKIAEGLPIVASTASMANMSIDELMAGLGTITAVTQETGRKAATAMRALILNIEGEIGTVIDEDMTITQESVKSMTDALKKYGNEAVKAAQKTGKLVDPMEAIRSLAEAFKSGDLSDQELFNILSPLGGKLRTNQLTALVTNYDMFAEMLDKVKTSAGSADREIDILLETWNAKTNQLKNSWTNLVANVIDSDLIKNGLDGIRAIIDGINELLEPKSGKENEVVNEYERLYGENGTLTKERKNLEAHLAVLNEFDKQRLEYLKAQENTLTQQVAEAHKLTQKERLSYLSEAVGSTGARAYLKRSVMNLSEFSKLYSEAIAEDGSKNRQQIHQALQSALSEYEKYYSIIKSLQEENVKITDKQALKFAEIYEEALKAAEKAAEDAKEEIERLGENIEDSGESLDDATSSLNNYAKAALEAAKAIEAFSDATQSTKSGNADAYRSAYQQFLEDYKAGKTDTNVVRAAADMFLPESIQEALGYDLQAMGELMASDLYQGIYNGASGNAGVDFVNYMAKNMTDALDEIVNISTNKDGTYNFEYASAQKLADYFNLPLGAIQALIGALDEFGVQAGIGWEEADNLANSLGLVGENADKSGITLESIARSLKEDFGYSDKVDIAKAINALVEGGYLEGILGELTPEAIGAAISAAFKEAYQDVEEEPEVVVEPDVKVEPEVVNPEVVIEPEIKAEPKIDASNISEDIPKAVQEYGAAVEAAVKDAVDRGEWQTDLMAEIDAANQAMMDYDFSAAAKNFKIEVPSEVEFEAPKELTKADIDKGLTEAYFKNGAFPALQLDGALKVEPKGGVEIEIPSDVEIEAPKTLTKEDIDRKLTEAYYQNGAFPVLQLDGAMKVEPKSAEIEIPSDLEFGAPKTVNEADVSRTLTEAYYKNGPFPALQMDAEMKVEPKGVTVEIPSDIEFEAPKEISADDLSKSLTEAYFKNGAFPALKLEDTIRAEPKEISFEIPSDVEFETPKILSSEDISRGLTEAYFQNGAFPALKLDEPVDVEVPVKPQIEFEFDGTYFHDNDIFAQIQDFLSEQEEDAELQVKIGNVNETEDDIDGIVSALEDVPGIKNVEFEDNAVNCEGNVDALREAIELLPSEKTITITLVTNGSLPDVVPHAKGTKYAPGGLSLVNELGPELISDNGRAYIANGGKPAIVNLGKGAVVLTAEETRQALGNATIYNGIGAYKGGLANTPLPIKTTGNSGTGSSGIPSTSSESSGNYYGDTGGSKKKKKDSDSSSSSSNSPWDDKEKALKDELDALEELAEWYHNQKMHDEEGDTYQKAIEKVDALRKEYLEAGFDETAKEVTTLANKIFDYEEDIADAKAHAIEDLEDELDILESQIELAENQGDLNRMLELQNEAQKKVAQLLEAYRAAGFSDTSPEILKLANMGYDYASDSGSTMKDLWKSLIEALEDMRDTQDEANDLAEKQLAVDEAREALQNAQNQRTVRVFNPVTGQWEWVADSKSIQQAQENLTKAEEALLKEQQSQELDAIKRAMENGGSLSDVTIGPGLSALLSGASLEQTNAFASALGLLSGGLVNSADTSAKSIFDSVDSHDNVTQYTFNGVTIDAATAENTTLAELTQMITPLALTTNMPA